jgi:hypothetical protein
MVLMPLRACCALVLTLGFVSAHAEESGTCSLETLRGTMSWYVTSTRAGVPHAASGFESYDGHGHLKYTELDSDGSTTSSYTGTGTYTITEDCQASVTYDGVGPAFVYFVAPDGSSYVWSNNQNAGTVASGRAERVSRALVVK